MPLIGNDGTLPASRIEATFWIIGALTIGFLLGLSLA